MELGAQLDSYIYYHSIKIDSCWFYLLYLLYGIYMRLLHMVKRSLLIVNGSSGYNVLLYPMIDWLSRVCNYVIIGYKYSLHKCVWPSRCWWNGGRVMNKQIRFSLISKRVTCWTVWTYQIQCAIRSLLPAK